MAMTVPRCRSATLDAVLDALEAELLGATAEELRDALQETSRAREGALREMRTLLLGVADEDRQTHVVRPLHQRDGPRLHRH